MLFCSTGITLPQPNASLSCSFAPQGLFPPAKCISIFLFCSTGIISAGQIHLYLALLLHRDYFRRPDSSLSRAFAPQGLFPPAGFISILLFCYTGIILPRPDASLSCFFAPQGLLCPSRMHLYLALLFHKDYFDRPNASLSCSFVTQGLFTPVGFIPSLLFCSTGIISVGRMHLYLPLLLHRDYFHRPNASLSCSFVTQGLFRPGRMHPYLPLLLHRDYFRRSNASLSCSFVTQGLFPPAGFISILLFCFTGIISTGQMHLYLALLFHRDYFRRSNASLIWAPVKYQRPNFYYTGNTRMASADTLCKKLPHDRQTKRNHTAGSRCLRDA